MIPEYRLRLEVDFARRKWVGTVTFDPPADTPSLSLDSDGLTIAAVRVGTRPIAFRVDPAKRKLVLPDLPPGTVSIDFSGTVAETVLIGLYRSRQGDGYVLTSQCEPNGASRIFPCLDRPDRKSQLALTVVTESALQVVTNTIEESAAETGGRREWRFPSTPKMSSYLFFLAIGRFDCIEDSTDRPKFRVFTPPGQGPSGRFALESARRILRAYEQYYGIPYPLPKLDLIAVAEASFGAMENWGAIAFRENRLLVDERSSSFTRREVFETIAHEVAHMWFGNLVTLTDWTDIWLNESLASFLETKISHLVDPSLDSQSDFFLRTAGTGAALEGDSLDATHPVRARVTSPEEVSQIFDEISYGKGSTLVGMIEAYLGEEPFRRGVADYLGRFQYSNATTADLWESLSRATGEPVGPLVDPWLDRPGVPSISVRSTDGGIELSQRRFSYHGATPSDPWPIPMVIDVDGIRERIRFDTPTRTLPVPVGATVHLNPGAVGFYRVLYDPALRNRLLRALPGRPAADRWSFLADLWAYLLSGEVDWPTFATAVRTLGGTPDRLVAEFLSRTLGPLAIFFPDSGPVQDLTRWFFSDQFARLGTARRPGDTTSDGVLRERISFGWVRVDSAFARQLSELFVSWDRVEPDLRPAVAVARARTAGAVGYRELRRALERRQPEGEQELLENALAWSNDPALVLETLDRACSGRVNRATVPEVIRNVAANPVGRPVLWPWFTSNLPRLDDLFRSAGLLSTTLEITLPVLGIGRGEEVRAYFRDHAYPEADRGIGKGLERLAILERTAPIFAALRN
ncbi:MAG: M1 family metallopeptidase [Thermoplasmata archaeon]|nr:M1 family metallopeptidase [Thermoplasmata archaeon]